MDTFIEQNKYKVSVVMPVYNKGVLFEEAAKNVLNQTIDSIELICVDDCSSDKKTLSVLEELANLPNVTVVKNKENVGAGKSRNIGFSYASGEYVIFLDADDSFDVNMLERMYANAKSNNADMCICGSKWKYANGICKSFDVDDTVHKKDNWIISISYNPWDKLVKRSVLRNENIYFQNLSSSNDIYYSCALFMVCKNITYLKEQYLVTYNADVEGQISSKRNPQNIVRVAEEIQNNFPKNEQLNNGILILFLVVNMIFEFRRCNSDNLKKECYETVKSIVSKNSNDELNITDKYMFHLVKQTLSEKYESRWFDTALNLEDRLRFYYPQIIDYIKYYKRPLLWGFGARGKAFADLCKEHGFSLWGIFDKNPNMINQSTNFSIISDQEVAINSPDVIIASNYTIANFINDKGCTEIVNLEDYC